MAYTRDELVNVAAQMLSTLIYARSGAQNKSPMFLYKPSDPKEPRSEVVDLALIFAKDLLERIDESNPG